MKLARKHVIWNSKEKLTPWWYVTLEWIGNKVEVLPIIEHAIGRHSNDSGVWLRGPETGLCDASWDGKNKRDAQRLYNRLLKLAKACRFRYLRLQLILTDPARPRSHGRHKVHAAFRRGKAPVLTAKFFSPKPKGKTA